MSRFIETICIQNGEIRNLEFHQERFTKTRYKNFGLTDELDLSNHIIISENQLTGKFKCRILYTEKIEQIEMLPYEIRKINSIKLVENNTIEYRFKSEDRTAFELMKDSITEDEIIILKNGQITDTSYSNLVFFDGENWITPTSYLLNGTMRQSLLELGKIVEEEVNPKDFNRFFSFKLINAMMDLEESPELPISIIS
ncbi:aminotransferase class IV [Moheibacter lacus]|uniref:Aminotransferase class IV n=1 Tax=Moheibacter lacus TaxID=2745851 RepID=A0A838ZPP9_9FLAO|nr:aminotransferase class IV [Moheibacter lacus]MBA5628855.1 aminotransferase class IV [Moheibacter lacus]